MKALLNRLVAVTLTAVMVCAGFPVAAFASETDSSSESSSVSQVITLDDEEEDEADSDSSSAADDEDGQLETQTYTSSVTVDDEGTVIDGDEDLALLATEAEDEETDADADADADSNSDSSSDGSADADGGSGSTSDSEETTEEVTLVSTDKDVTTTYKLTISLATKTTSSGIIKTVKVSRPKITTTKVTVTTKTYSDGSTKESSKTSKTTKTYSLSVKVYVRGVGWEKAALNSAGTSYSYTASSSSSGAYITAVKITPTSNLKTAMSKAGYTFVYRAKTESFGTLGWAKAGNRAGTVGNNCALTGLTLKVVTTAKAKTLDTSNHYISTPKVTYKTKKTGSSSWSSASTNGSTSGSTSGSSTVGSVAVKLTSSSSFSGSIKYSVRSSTTDSSSKWTSYKKNYTAAGSGSNKIRAIKIKLTGDMATYYDVYYRVYVKGIGWLGWASNGQKAGTEGTSSAISAIQIKLVVKGQDAPGSTSYRYVSSSTAKMNMVLKAQSFSSTSKYLILVDRAHCKVGIFTGSTGNWTLKYYWSCCVGKASTPTISGSYTVGSKGYSFGSSTYTCYYYTQISGNYLFHSILYNRGTFTVRDGTMGKAVSHGCVRLTLEHAKWIYTYIPRGTKVYIY